MRRYNANDAVVIYTPNCRTTSSPLITLHASHSRASKTGQIVHGGVASVVDIRNCTVGLVGAHGGLEHDGQDANALDKR